MINLNQRPDLAVFLAKAEELCSQHGAQLMFLTVFGSGLYGTQSPGYSDIDLRGIFLPSLQSLALNQAHKSLRYSTGSNECRNTCEDVDIDLWSVQYWLKLLAEGDTGAIDMIYAPSNAEAVVYCHGALKPIFAEPLRLIGSSGSRGYAEYSLGQAKKYGIKGSRLGAIKRVWQWLNSQSQVWGPKDRLGSFIGDIATYCDDGRYCFPAETPQGAALHLCGKTYMGGMRLAEFSQRLQSDMDRYGARALDAERNEGLDFKALSHAVRAIYQMEELLSEGRIVFPLRNRDELLAIKQGQRPWVELEPYILERLRAVEELEASAPFRPGHEPGFARECLLKCYEVPPVPAPERRFHPGFDIPAKTRWAIEAKLAEAEKKEGVKIIYACESGSRGWGFGSANSDFDVRFIYIHPPKWYLGVSPELKPDVLDLGIEDSPVGELDINGWELRKALKLFKKTNQPLIEWLSSPLIYLERGHLPQTLRDLAPVAVSPLRAWLHYNNLMQKAWNTFLAKGGSIKQWFYILRPLMARQWIEQGLGVVPMRFDLVLDGVIADSELRAALDELIEQKKEGLERDKFVPPQLVADYVEGLRHKLDIPPGLAATGGWADYDSIFLATLQEIWSGSEPLLLPRHL